MECFPWLHLISRVGRQLLPPPHSDACTKCGHIVATHSYTFSYDIEFQVRISINPPYTLLSSAIFPSSHYTPFNLSSPLPLLPPPFMWMQEYTMECMLCGHGEHTQSVLPDDPRGQEMY